MPNLLNKKKLTILTATIPSVIEYNKEKFKSKLRPILRFFDKKKSLTKQEYGGHYAVTRSLIEGLKKTGANFSYNPKKITNCSDVVLVLAGINVLRQAIKLKEKGKIKKLITGPNIVDHVMDFDNIVAHPLVDGFIVPSEWVKSLVLADCHALTKKIIIWHAGVNSEYWKPSVQIKDKVLIYKKTESIQFHQQVKHFLIERNFEVFEIDYGKYSQEEFKSKLNNCHFAVFISRNESQGIALAESWSMNVPTLVYDPGNFVYRGNLINNISACPYLTSKAGKSWKTMEELLCFVDQIKKGDLTFSPRELILQSFTDEICSRNLLTSIENFN